MLITPAYAQAAGAAQGGDMFSLLMPMILVFAIMYFLMIRPQQKKQKRHQAKLAAVKRGDKVITGGGIYGTVRKIADDGKLSVEIAKDTQIDVVSSTLMDVIVKGEPQAGAQPEAPKGLLASIFGGGKAAEPAKAPSKKTEETTEKTTEKDKEKDKDKDSSEKPKPKPRKAKSTPARKAKSTPASKKKKPQENAAKESNNENDDNQ